MNHSWFKSKDIWEILSCNCNLCKSIHFCSICGMYRGYHEEEYIYWQSLNELKSGYNLDHLCEYMSCSENLMKNIL